MRPYSRPKNHNNQHRGVGEIRNVPQRPYAVCPALQLLIAASLAAVAAVACGTVSSSPSSDRDVFFPKHEAGAVPDALVGGKLISDEQGCIRLEVPGANPTLIWSPDYELGIGGNDKVQILDGEGRVAAKVGDEVTLGGGFVGDSLEGIGGVSFWTKRELRERCPGPYWYAGEVKHS